MNGDDKNGSQRGRVVVIGGGPTGIGAAIRLTELNHGEWVLVDAGDRPGGLSRSFVDEHGYTWDVGGHVIFSHYQYFDDLMDAAFPPATGWNYRQREAWVRSCGRWVPFPFQANIHRLPEKERQECLEGLEAAVRAREAAAAEGAPKAPASKVTTFEDYIYRCFGDGIARVFMMPYNRKVWTVPPSQMTAAWTGERVVTVDLDKIRRSIETGEDDVGWGPNASFRFPKHGGTGAIYKSIVDKFLPKDKFRLGSEVVGLRPLAKQLFLSSAPEQAVAYDRLISTMPLDYLLELVAAGLEAEGAEVAARADPELTRFAPAQLRELAGQLVYSNTLVVGIGLRGPCPEHLKTSCWLYFPDNEAPFYRATVFSNYADTNVPEPGATWSLMLEVGIATDGNDPRAKETNEALGQECLRGCVASGLITEEDAAKNVVSLFTHRETKGYPIPSLSREGVLVQVQPWLRDVFGIYSRGRFGGWRYEVANQDHSLLQGVEAVDEALLQMNKEAQPTPVEGDGSEHEVNVQLYGQQRRMVRGEPTYHRPEYVNNRRNTLPCALAKSAQEE